MSLRPRYSLLTLLILTALVAGGVMYFRIPHRAIVSDPPTDEEFKHLSRNMVMSNHANHLGPTELEYEYLKTWNGSQWLTVVGRPRNNPLVLVEGDPIRQPVLWAIFDQVASAKMLAGVSEPQEIIVSWVMACEKTPYEERTVTMPIGSGIQVPVFALPENMVIYFLTKSGRIFRSESSNYSTLANPIELQEIEDPQLHSRVVEELSKITPPK